jgi:hypothetical protein
MCISFRHKREAGIVFPFIKKINIMIRTDSTQTTKKLALRFILENIDYRKRCLYLQEIISLGKANDVWRQALAAFFDTPLSNISVKAFSKN